MFDAHHAWADLYYQDPGEALGAKLQFEAAACGATSMEWVWLMDRELH